MKLLSGHDIFRLHAIAKSWRSFVLSKGQTCDHGKLAVGLAKHGI